ncbi:prolargin [Polypterus senegalus]
MRTCVRYFLLLSLAIAVVQCQRRRPTKPTPPQRKPHIPKPEPKEPTDFPPVIFGPPSIFPDCPKECFCPPDFPTAIHCENRNLRKIPVIPARTQHLYLQNNFIDEVTEDSFKNASELRWLNLDNNRIKKVERSVLEKLSSLLFLYLGKNNLQEVPGFLPPNLEQLRLCKNQISKIPSGVFNKLEHLSMLDLNHNKLTDGDVGKNIFKGLKNLVQLNLAHNSLKKMPTNVPLNINQLFLDRNNIEDIPGDYFKSFSKLAFLRLNNNLLTDKGVPKNIFNISSLLDLHLAHNKLHNVPIFSHKLEHLYINHNSIQKINGTEICPFPIMAIDWEKEDEQPHLRFLRMDGNAISPPIPLDLIMCFRNLKSIVI